MNLSTVAKREEAAEALRDRIIAVAEYAEVHCADKIYTVASGKGGIGKSTLAKELAYVTGSILVDLDWDGGNLTTLFGHDVDKYRDVPILDALESGTPPKLVTMLRRPDLVPGHPHLATNQPSAEGMKKALISWNGHFKRSFTADTHPGGGAEVTRGAIAAADRVLMPVELGTAELNALEADLASYDGYPLLLVMNKVRRAPSDAHLNRLIALARRWGVPIAETAIHNHPWLTTGLKRTMITATPGPLSAQKLLFIEDIVNLAEEVTRYGAAA